MEIAITIIVVLLLLCVVLAYLLARLKGEMERYKAGEAERIRKAREEAVERSREVLGGKFVEQMAPYLPGFKYDPTEARFIGSPVDLIVFPGLAEGEPREVVLIEVKAGESARLTARERRIREIVEAGRVRWELLHRPPSM